MRKLYYWRETNNPFSYWHLSEWDTLADKDLQALCCRIKGNRKEAFEYKGTFEEVGVKGWTCKGCYDKLSVIEREYFGEARGPLREALVRDLPVLIIDECSDPKRIQFVKGGRSRYLTCEEMGQILPIYLRLRGEER